MSEHAHRMLSEAHERSEAIEKGQRFAALLAALAAVLASFGMVLSHHTSITALGVKNQAILSQARATDAYNRYEAMRIRGQLYQALIAAEITTKPDVRKTLQSFADKSLETSEAAQAKAQTYETDAENLERRSEQVLRSYEIIEVGTAFFEIAIVLVSISTLAGARGLLIGGGGLCAVGVVLVIAGLIAGH